MTLRAAVRLSTRTESHLKPEMGRSMATVGSLARRVAITAVAFGAIGRGNEETVDAMGLEGGDLPFFEEAIFVGGDEDGDVVLPAGFEFHAASTAGPERIGYAGDDDADDTGATAAQTARQIVGLVAETLNGFAHTLRSGPD